MGQRVALAHHEKWDGTGYPNGLAGVSIPVEARICAVLNHRAYEVLPPRWLRGPPGRWLISAAHHELHHKRVRCNYGLYFRVWDKLMGTDEMHI